MISFFSYLALLFGISFMPDEIMSVSISLMTSSGETSANVNTIFCICFIFSAAAFAFGAFLLNPNIYIFEQTKQQWMGFLQLFGVVYMVNMRYIKFSAK